MFWVKAYKSGKLLCFPGFLRHLSLESTCLSPVCRPYTPTAASLCHQWIHLITQLPGLFFVQETKPGHAKALLKPSEGSRIWNSTQLMPMACKPLVTWPCPALLIWPWFHEHGRRFLASGPCILCPMLGCSTPGFLQGWLLLKFLVIQMSFPYRVSVPLCTCSL